MPSFRRAGTVIAAVLGVGLLDQQVVTPLIAALATALGASVPEVGWAISAYAIAAAAAALVVGPLSDESGRRPWLIAAGTLLAGAAAAVALWPSYPVFLAARIGAGAAGGVISVVAVAWVADLVAYARRGRAMAILMGAAMGAATLGQVGAAFVAEAIGLRAAYLGLAGFAAAATALVAIFPAPPHHAAPRGGLARKVRTYARFARDPALRAAALGAFFMSGSLVGVTAYASGWMQESRGFTLPQIGLLYGGFGLVILVVQPLSGPLADRFGKKRLAVLASVAVAALTLLVPALAGRALVAAVLGFGCLAVARIAAFAALRSELVEAQRRASFLAFSNTLSQLGIAAAAGLGGALYGRGFFAVCVAMAGFGLLAAVLIARVPEPGRSRNASPR